MSTKYSFAKGEQYGRRLAARLCDQHFSPVPATALDGAAVLSFTPIHQLNLLVVHQLLHQWQTEISRLRSPYFDFEAPAVQAALTQFQNILSRHIRLTRPVFEPLLAQAVADTLHLALDPINAFDQIFFQKYLEPTLAQLRDGLRYLDVNKAFFAAFFDTLSPNQPLSHELLLSQLRAYHAVHYRSQQPIESLVAALSALLPLKEADLRAAGGAASSNLASASIPAATSQAIAPIAGVPTGVVGITEPATISTTPLTEPSIISAAPQSVLPDTSAETPLYKKLKATQPNSASLAATHWAAAAPPRLAPFAERNAPKIETLREAISINQRFSFINELFNGENMEYHAAIQHLDSLASQEQALRYITQNLSQRYDWHRKEEHVAKLLKLVERKYTTV